MQLHANVSHSIFLLAILGGSTAVSSASPTTETSAFVGANTTNDYKTSATGAPLTSSRSRPGSSITTTATPGSMSIIASAAGSPDVFGYASGNAAAQDTYTVSGGSGSGIATFTFYVTGSIAATRTSGSLANYSVSFDFDTAITGRSDQYSNSGSHPPQTLVFTRGFTYDVPFDLHANIFSELSMPNGSSGSANLLLRCAGYSVNASNYTGSSTAGTTRGTMLAPNAAYDGIALANTRNFLSTVTLLDGNASAQRDVAINFMAPATGLTAVSDIVDIKGTGNDLVVVQLNYDQAAALAASSGAENVILSWFDTVTQIWENAVQGNTGGTSNFKLGAYAESQDLVLGKWGIDRQADVVWAVVDHNSQFAALPGQLPTPPTDFTAWKSLNFTEAELSNVAISGPDADSDADSLSNFQEYAFFIDPRNYSPSPVTRSMTTLGNSLTYLTMTYNRRKGATDVTFSPQFGSDIQFWTNGFNVSIVDNLDGSEKVTDRDNTSTQDLTGKRFARIQVSP